MARIIKEGNKPAKHFCHQPGSHYTPAMKLGSIWECDCGKRYKVKMIGMGHTEEIWKRTPSPAWWNRLTRWLANGPTQKEA